MQEDPPNSLFFALALLGAALSTSFDSTSQFQCTVEMACHLDDGRMSGISLLLTPPAPEANNILRIAAR